jgi:hypothetical protein
MLDLETVRRRREEPIQATNGKLRRARDKTVQDLEADRSLDGMPLLPRALWPYMLSGIMVTSALLTGVALGAWLSGH